MPHSSTFPVNGTTQMPHEKLQSLLIPSAQSFNPSNHSPEAVDLTSESSFDSFLSVFQYVQPATPAVCLFLGWDLWCIRSKVNLLNVRGLPFRSRTGPIVTESSQLRPQGLQLAALAWRRHSRKEGHVLSQVLMIKSFQNYFQIFKLEPIDEDIFIKADMQAYSNLCAWAILMVTL